MNALVQQIRTLILEADDVSRAAVFSAINEIQQSLETPFATLQRVGSSVPLLASLRIGTHIGLFRALVSAGDGQSVEELAKACNVPSDWVRPVLWVLAAHGWVKEAGKDVFAANKATTSLADEVGEAGVTFFFDAAMAICAALPAAAAENGYRMFTSPQKSAIQKAFDTDLGVFDFLNTRPDLLKAFHIAMTTQRTTDSWMTKYALQKELGDWPTASKPVFVDVGGGLGQQCIALRSAFPQLEGTIILQDQQEVIDRAEELPGITKMGHDFFKPQPVKEAKFYYFRMIFHDHPDDKCLDILRHTREVMGPDSRVLIDDMVLPDTGISVQAAQMNLLMAAAHGAKERRDSEWRQLLADAGLKVVETLNYSSTTHDTLTVAAPA